MLTRENALLLVIDIQGKLADLMHDRHMLFANVQRMVRGAQILDLPILVTEQNPQGLGSTIPEISKLLEDVQTISKVSFNSCATPRFLHALEQTGRKQILITGIETHICVYQTSIDLLRRGYAVEVVVDAVSSRTALNKQIGLDRMRTSGAALTSTEMALYELLQVAEGPAFKAILKLVK